MLMKSSPEFEPGFYERVPFGLMYSASVDRFFEAVARSGSPHVKFWQLTKSPMVGVTEMPQFYGLIKLVSDSDAHARGRKTTILDLQVPLTGADVSAPLPVDEQDEAAHLIVRGYSSNKKLADPEVIVSPSSVRVLGGGKEAIVSMAGKTGVGSLVVDDNPNPELQDPVPTDITRYEWCMSVAARIGFFDLIPTIIEPDSHLTL